MGRLAVGGTTRWTIHAAVGVAGVGLAAEPFQAPAASLERGTRRAETTVSLTHRPEGFYVRRSASWGGFALIVAAGGFTVCVLAWLLFRRERRPVR